MRRHRSCTAPLDKAAQVRELEEFLRGRNPIDVAAADWHMRRQQGLTAAEEAEFTQWLQASTAHEAALRHLGHLHHLDRGLPAAQRPCTEGDKGCGQGWGWRWPHLLPRPALTALCCTVALAMGWPQRPAPTSNPLTAHGQAKTVTLPDGSQASPGPDRQSEGQGETAAAP